MVLVGCLDHDLSMNGLTLRLASFRIFYFLFLISYFLFRGM